MSTTRRKFTREFKLAAVKRLQSGYPVGRVRAPSGAWRRGRWVLGSSQLTPQP